MDLRVSCDESGLEEFDLGGALEVAGVGFVSVDVNLKLEGGIDAGDEVVKAGVAAGRGDFEGDFIEMFDAVMPGVVGRHVNVTGGADDAVFHFQHAFWPEDVAAGGAVDIAGHADGNVHAELDGVGESELDLGKIAAGAENAKVRDDAAARADEGDGLLGGELAFLIEPLVDGKLSAGAEEEFEGLRGDVHVAGGAVYEENGSGAGLI